jgi:phosphoribosylformylglycinamidine synthase subunit PurS
MPKVTIHVTLKSSLLDAQGRTIESSLHQMGYPETQNVRVGKIIQMDIEGTTENAKVKAKEMCEKLLANPNMESYKIEVAQ